MKFNFMINTLLFNFDKKDFSNVKLPFLSLYDEYYKSIVGIMDSAESNIRLFSNTNNEKLFYTGLEPKANSICENRKKELTILLNEYKTKFKIDPIIKNVKIRLNNKDNGKCKRLLCLLCSFNLDLIDRRIHFDILFPIEYKDWH